MAVAFIFMSITAISVSMTFAAIAVQSAVRSYVAGEGQYSKAQRDASFLLHRYGQTGDPDYLRRFERALIIPIGDRIAREELQKPAFDLAVAERALIDGDNHPADVRSQIWLFRCCSQLPSLRRAIELWTRADEEIAQLQAIAVEMRTEVESKWPSAIRLSELLSRVESVNEAVHPIQAAFTATLGDAARSISSLLMMVTLTIIVLLVALGTYLSLRIVRSIRSSEDQYRTLMHSASDGLIVVDRADGRVLEINECAEGMIGTAAAQLIGVPYNSLFSGPDVNLQPGFEETGLQLSTLLAASGDPVEVEVKCSATSWNQRPAQLAIVRDVSKRLSTERMLRVATNAMANMTEAVVITDERFRVVSVNGAFTAITGYRPAEMAGKVPGYRGVPQRGPPAPARDRPEPAAPRSLAGRTGERPEDR
jgi:PAS domain S-box-containing protein